MFKMYKISLIFLLIGFMLQALSAEDSDIERFTVTGSHIKELDREGTTPVTTIDREQLDFSGAGSLGDVIRSLSFASFGVTRKYSLADKNGGSITSFRGLPQGYVLILINGKRLANPDQDINLIPLSAIERVEIIKDGASAIYGSDAVGGVMNFITKRGDIGSTFSVGFYLPEPFVLPKKALPFQGWRSQGWAEVPKFQNKVFGLKGGEELRADYSYGWTGDSQQTLLSVTGRLQRSYSLQDRPFSTMDSSDVANFSTMGSPGSYSFDGETYKAMDDCPPERILSADKDKGTPYCRFNYAETMELAPMVGSLALFLTTDMDVNEDMSLYAHSLVSYEYSKGKLAPAPDSLKKEKFVKNMNALGKDGPAIWDNWVKALGTESGLDLSELTHLYYRMVDENDGQGRLNNAHIITANLQAELDFYISDTWSLLSSLSSGGYLSLSRGRNYFKVSELLSLNEEGLARWNPFRTDRTQNDVSDAKYVSTNDERYLINLAEITSSGEVAPLGDFGTLNSAFGVRGIHEYWGVEVDKNTYNKDKAVMDQWGGNAGKAGGKGNRFSGALYTEFALPMKFNEMNSLDFQLAGSFDWYQYAGIARHESLFGKDLPFKLPVTPKLSGKWNILDLLNIRGSWGKGFKAPIIELVHVDHVKDHPFGVDYVQCAKKGETKKDCKQQADQYEVFYNGNKNLKPEHSEFLNFGVTFENPSLNLMVSLDYFRNQIKGRINEPQITDIVEMEAYHSEAFQSFSEENEITIERSGARIDGIHTKYYNFADYKSHGLEANIAFRSPVLTNHTFFLDAQTVYFLDISTKRPFLDKNYVKKTGHWAYPSYKALMQVGLRYKNGLKWALVSQLVSRFNQDSAEEEAPDTGFEKISKWVRKNMMSKDVKKGVKACYTKTSCEADENAIAQVPAHFTFDLAINTPLSAINSTWSSKSSLLFKIENILNTIPPHNRIKGGNRQQTVTGVNMMGFQPNGMYSGINGRAWQLRYTHKF